MDPLCDLFVVSERYGLYLVHCRNFRPRHRGCVVRELPVSEIASIASTVKRVRYASVMVLLVACATSVVWAQELTLRPGHPEQYTVQRGDTLWDISGRFLNEPWRWTEIWQDNPQVRNPDLIYPGDELVLQFREGRPVLTRARRGVVKLSPQIHATPIGGAIPAIPIDAIAQFLHRPRVLTDDEFESAPYVVSVGKENLLAGAGSTLYVRGPLESTSSRYAVFRRGDAYRSLGGSGELLGYEALQVGDAVLTETGDPATMLLERSSREVQVGDRLLPSTDEEAESRYVPRAPATQVEGQIISIIDGVAQVGQLQVVVLDVGARDGVESGTVLAVYQRGPEILDAFARSPKADLAEPPSFIERDPARQGGIDGFSIAADRLVRAVQDLVTPEDDSYRRVRLPDEQAGVVMVFRSFERVSYALVMNATRAIHTADVVRNP